MLWGKEQNALARLLLHSWERSVELKYTYAVASLVFSGLITAVNMMLLTFAAAVDRWDRQTDTRTLDHFMDSTPRSIQAVSVVQSPVLCYCILGAGRRVSFCYVRCNSVFLTVEHNTTTTGLRPLYRSAYVSWHLQLSTGIFRWCNVLLPSCPCWLQPAHLDYGEDTGVLLSSVICVRTSDL